MRIYSAFLISLQVFLHCPSLLPSLSPQRTHCPVLSPVFRRGDACQFASKPGRLCCSCYPPDVHLPPPAWWPATSPTRRTRARSTRGSSSATWTRCWSPRRTSRPSSPSMARSWAAPSTRATPSCSTPTRGTLGPPSTARTAAWSSDKSLVGSSVLWEISNNASYVKKHQIAYVESCFANRCTIMFLFTTNMNFIFY